VDEFRSPDVAAAVAALAADGGLKERGAVFTKTGVVEAILDLCGYTDNHLLHEMRFLEPSFGGGDFIFIAVERLMSAFMRSGGDPSQSFDALTDCIRGFELHTATFGDTRERLANLLATLGVPEEQAVMLTESWLVNDDFLLARIDGSFDVVAGNPPYVRQERIPETLLKAYKRKYRTLYDRADLYIMFYERGLDLLTGGGVLGYICANRWVKNKYGGPLRLKVAEGYRLKHFLDLERADAFHEEVIAYPAITVIQRGTHGPTHVATENQESAVGLHAVVEELQRSEQGEPATGVAVVHDVAVGRSPWLLDAPHILNLLRYLESGFLTVEQSGAKVGIGVATGADRVFIRAYDELAVEPDRKLRLAMAADCANGGVTWSGKGVINPYLKAGGLAPLADYPRFSAYMHEHGDVLKQRHTARKQPSKWYRTIDRIYPDLTHQPKLLIPDIKGEAVVSFDPGECYPHHNLYVVTSDLWDLQALQAVLRSSVALTFVAAYCVRMAGGFLRFQAQYLRRIRVPDPRTLTKQEVDALVAVASSGNQAEVDAAVMPLYGLSVEAEGEVLAFAHAARVARKKGK